MRFPIIFLLWIAAIEAKEQYNVLILGPVGSKSLHHLIRALAESLSDGGHSVTLVSSFTSPSPYRNVKEIYTGAPRTNLLEDRNIFNMRDILSAFEWMEEVADTVGKSMWTNEEIINLWKDRNNFDAIVMIAYVNEIATPFLVNYKGVFITLCTPGVEVYTMHHQGHWLPMSVVPNILLPYDEHMSFSERVINPIVTLFVKYFYLYHTRSAVQRKLEVFFPDLPDYLELYESSKLTLINGHFSMDGPVPLLPTQVEIGTINAKDPKPLPEDLKSFADGSGDAGVIYFSLGSFIRSTDMPLSYKRMFVEVFKQLPQRIIWKYEDDDLELPPNVITRKWMPQQDILGHPKTRLFISHCGNLGTQEAKYHGVPVLAIPVAVDQPRNAARMVRKGFGLMIDWDNLNAELLNSTIHTLLTDPKYSNKLKEISAALKDQKESPGERAVWWIEYMIRHKDSTYTQYAGRKLHFLQYQMVDVAILYLCVIILWASISYYCCKRMYRFCFKSNNVKNAKKVKHS